MRGGGVNPKFLGNFNFEIMAVRPTFPGFLMSKTLRHQRRVMPNRIIDQNRDCWCSMDRSWSAEYQDTLFFEIG